MLTAVQADLYLHHLEIQSNNPLGLAKFYSNVMSMKLNKVNNKKLGIEASLSSIFNIRDYRPEHEPTIYANLSSYAILIERYINKIFIEIEAYHNNDLNKD